MSALLIVAGAGLVLAGIIGFVRTDGAMNLWLSIRTGRNVMDDAIALGTAIRFVCGLGVLTGALVGGFGLSML